MTACGSEVKERARQSQGPEHERIHALVSAWHDPAAIAAVAPRRFSDNVALIGRRCA